MERNNYKKLICVSLIGFFTVCPVLGQALKKVPLTAKDYPLWHRMENEMLSDDGKWVSYSLRYESGLDTLFVRESKGRRLFAFANATSSEFNGKWFGCLANGKLQLIDLATGKSSNYGPAERYGFADNHKVVILNGKEGERSFVSVIDRRGKEVMRFADGVGFYLNSQGSEMLVEQQDANRTMLKVVSLVHNSVPLELHVVDDLSISRIAWADGGNAVVFSTANGLSQSLHLYRKRDKKMFQLDKQVGWDANLTWSCSEIAVADQGSRVLFYVRVKEEKKATTMVNVWNAQDAVLQPQRLGAGTPRILCEWFPDSGKLNRFTGEEVYAVTPDSRYAMLRDTKPYLPTLKLAPDTDYLLYDLKTKKEQLFLKEFGGMLSFRLSPDARYLIYFKERDWWVYDFAKAKHRNLTKRIAVSFANDEREKRESNSFAQVVWVMDEERILLCDAFDIWSIAIDGGKTERLTKGRESKTRYRISKSCMQEVSVLSGQLRIASLLDGKNPILVETVTEDFSRSGFGTMALGKDFEPLLNHSKSNTVLGFSKKGKCILYSEENFNEPEVLSVCGLTDNNSHMVFRSNLHHYGFEWGKSELIAYETNLGKSLKGVLFYPAGFESGKKYPMVVSIYEKQGFSLHRYVHPTLYNGTGFNIAHLTAQGYFVLLPDISYEYNDPGLSALGCVRNAVESAVKLECIDSANLGLIGHSFGGYETNFIITQTSLFKVAVSGAGITDNISRYLSFSRNHLTSETWRYEYSQHRMGGSLFEDRESYRRNSPIEFVDKITTPLLSFTGECDTQVPPEQTMEFYMALRRLNKSHIMLTYPDQGHVFTDKIKQADLTKKITDWFNFYLRKGEMKPWMSENY